MITGQDNECQTAKPRWALRPDRNADAKILAEQLNLSPVTAKVLALRVGNDIQKARNFINPVLATMLSPFEMRDMNVCRHQADCSRRSAVKSILSYLAIMMLTELRQRRFLFTIFSELGADVSHYLPSQNGGRVWDIRRIH